MKKLALAFVVAVGLGGCAQVQQALDILPKVTASINNPVTPDMLYAVENGMIVAFAGLNAYKRACVNLMIEQTCRGTIRQIQVYTRRIPPLLKQLRSFVRGNDQINAVVVYNQVMALIAEFKGVAATKGISVQ